ncbi:unnamed protein product [Arabidopsis lyrata]|nr:unnamed protein product [Arabidopsis lyrata]
MLAFYHSTLYQHPVEVQAIRKVKAQANQLYRRSFHCPLSVSHPTSLNFQYGAQRVTWTRTRESRDAVTNGSRVAQAVELALTILPLRCLASSIANLLSGAGGTRNHNHLLFFRLSLLRPVQRNRASGGSAESPAQYKAWRLQPQVTRTAQ